MNELTSDQCKLLERIARGRVWSCRPSEFDKFIRLGLVEWPTGKAFWTASAKGKEAIQRCKAPQNDHQD